MAMEQKEIEEIAKQAKVIAQLNVTEFLKTIKERAEKWKKDLTHG